MGCHTLIIPIGITIIVSTVPVANALDDIFCKSAITIRKTNDNVENMQQANQKVRKRRKIWYAVGILSGVMILVEGTSCASIFLAEEFREMFN